MMIACQRWNHGLDLWAPTQRIQTRDYEVAAIERDAVAKAFVLEHHYSGSYPAARFRYGLYYKTGDLVGVAVFSVPAAQGVITSNLPCAPNEGVELGRFVLLDSVPGNGESWFLGRCFAMLRQEQLFGVVSYSDPMPRTNAEGRRVFAGHLGTIYQAHNARYLGRGGRRTIRLLPNGTTFSDRAATKIRSGERGWRYSAAILQRLGADELSEDADKAQRLSWLSTWRERLTRPARHPGNHRYVWSLSKQGRRHLQPGIPYPKDIAA
jgi:hypothetical protein